MTQAKIKERIKGKVTQIIGVVVDTEFKAGELPCDL